MAQDRSRGGDTELLCVQQASEEATKRTSLDTWCTRSAVAEGSYGYFALSGQRIFGGGPFFLSQSGVEKKTAGDVTQALKSIFATHGVPMKVAADNMLLCSSQMGTFADGWGFIITTSSPNYPHLNGTAER